MTRTIIFAAILMATMQAPTTGRSDHPPRPGLDRLLEQAISKLASLYRQFPNLHPRMSFHDIRIVENRMVIRYQTDFYMSEINPSGTSLADLKNTWRNQFCSSENTMFDYLLYLGGSIQIVLYDKAAELMLNELYTHDNC